MNNNTGNNDIVCKLILVGNGSAGKTSLCTRFKDDGFRKVYKQTIGIDFYERTLRIRNKRIILQLWDIGGQSIGSNMLPKYITGTSAIFLVYDITDPNSFADIQDWYRLIQRCIKEVAEHERNIANGTGGISSLSLERIPTYIVGNKMDLQHLRKIPKSEQDSFIQRNKLDGGFYTSARSGENVLTAFYSVAAQQLGMSLTPGEIEATRKLLGVVVGVADDTARTAFADEIERMDREAQAKRDSAVSCCVLQ